MKTRFVYIDRITLGIIVFIGFGLLNVHCTHAKKSSSLLYQQWVYTDSDGSMSVWDFTDEQHYIAANTFTIQQCKEVQGAYDPGVFYLSEKEKMRVTFDTQTSGTIEYLGYSGQWHERCMFTDLTDKSVILIFEGEFEWPLKVAENPVVIINPDTEELNVSDMGKIVTFYDVVPDIFRYVCEGTNLKQLEKHQGVAPDYCFETWGRNVKASGWELTKNGDDALAIHYLFQPGNFSQVRLVFSDKRLIPVYEKQLARIGYFKKRTRQVEGTKETTYGDENWSPDVKSSYYTLCDDGTGQYDLFYNP